MNVVTVKRYVCDCGKRYSKKSIAEKHEINCKCFTNPKFKTCKTCKHGKLSSDSDDYTHWKYWECEHKDFDYEKDFIPAFEGCKDLCINCKYWELNN